MYVRGRHQVSPNCECVLFIIEIVENTKHIVWIPLEILYLVAIHEM